MNLVIDCPQLGEQTFTNVLSFEVQDESVEVTFNQPGGEKTTTIDGTLVSAAYQGDAPSPSLGRR